MQYEVWVEASGGGSRVPIQKGEDPDKAAKLVSALVNAGAGTSFGVGVTINTPEQVSGSGSAVVTPAATGRNR